MAIGPRLDLRQSQSLVMTPQLRQAIKLLQFSNIEVASFVDEELERNPLLERDEIAEGGPLERPAIDQIEALAPARDLTDTIRSETLPTEGASPLDAEYAETYDPGTNSDGGGRMDLHGNGARGFDDGERTIDDFAAASRTLREHLSEQVRLTFSDPAERMIAAHLLAILDPSGRLSAMPEALAAALGTDINRVEAVREKMMRFDPVGMFARDLRECLAVQLRDRNRYDPAMAALLDNLDLLARRELRQLMAVCEVDAADLTDMIAEIKRLDPKPGTLWDAVPPQPLIPDVLMRAAPDGAWLLELNPETMRGFW